MRRHFKVIGCRLVFVDASCHVEGRAMARAKEPTGPIVRKRCLRAGNKSVRRGATQMRADTHRNQKLGFDGARLVSGVKRSQFVGLALRLGVGQQSIYLGQLSDLRGCAPHDPNRLTAPFNRELFAWFDGADVYFNRGTGGSRPLRRLEGADEGNNDSRSTQCPRAG